MTEQVLVSIVIPVKNGFPNLPLVLEAVSQQETDFPFEVVIIDSGSSDGSLELARRYNAKLLEISPHEFNHGSTRNQAIAASSGRFVALLTHDAIPADRHWLKNLVTPLLTGDGKIAGVFGRHIARSNEDPIVEVGLYNHFDRFHRSGRRTWCKDADYQQKRGEYVFFSNNNSCMRKDVWEKIPFNHTDMAEDQQWAEAILEAGYTKAYAHDSVVIHSHSYPTGEWMRRSFDEYRSYFKLGLVETRGLKQTVKNALWLWRNDVRELRKLNKSKIYKIIWIWRRFWISWAIALGQYFGTNFDKLPKSWLGFFSMQLRNIRANG
jgi:rhamnosyltransferase